MYPITKILGITDSRRNIKCPNPIHNDRKPSAHIYMDTNAVFCFTCRKFYRVSDIIKFNGLNKILLYRELKEIYPDQNINNLYEENKESYEKKTFVKKKTNDNFINFTKKYFL